MTINFTGTVSSLTYPTIAGLRSDLIARLALDNAPPSSVGIVTTILGSVEWHYDVTGSVVFPDDLGWSGPDLISEVSTVFNALTGYQFTASANTPQPALSDPIADPINGALQGAETALQSVKDMGGNIAAGVAGAAKSLEDAASAAAGAAAATAQHIEKDVLIVAGLIVVGIVIIAFSPQVSKAAGALR